MPADQKTIQDQPSKKPLLQDEEEYQQDEQINQIQFPQAQERPIEEEQKKKPDLIHKHKSSTKIIFHAIVACMGAFYCGFALGELNMAQPTLDVMYGIGDTINISKDLANALITGAMPLGGIIGCLVAGEVLKRLGRRTVFYICDIVAIIISGFFMIKSFYMAMIMRFLMGIMSGINQTLTPLYLREISPVSISGVIGIFNQGFVHFGILSGYLLGLGFPLDPYESDEFYWRFVLAFPIITSLIRIIGISTAFRKDTAVYYLNHNKFEKAKAILFKVYKEEYQQEIYDYYHKAAMKKKMAVDSWSLVFSANYRSRLLLGSLLQVFRQFSGMNAIIFYSSTIFENCFGDRLLANYMTVVSGGILMCFSFMSGLLTKRFGRKPIILVGETILIITLICIGIVSFISKDQVAQQNVSTFITVLIISLIFLFEIIFCLTIGSVSSVYNADILNSEKALGFASAMNQVSTFINGLLYPMLQSALGTYSTFFIFSGFCLVGTIYFKIYLKETRGLQQTQIVDIFEKQQEEKEQKRYMKNDTESTTVSQKKTIRFM